MQNTQNVVWWLEILKIAVPSLIALVVPFIAGYLLLKRTENYKKELSKEIESYKSQLQTDFQTRFYQFQTKFSALHNEQANVVKELFVLLVDVDRKSSAIKNHKDLSTEPTSLFFKIDEDEKEKSGEKLLQNLFESFDKFYKFYQEKRIFISADVCRTIENFAESSAKLMTHHYLQDFLQNNLNDEYRSILDGNEYKELFINSIPDETNGVAEALNQLENEFRNLISFELPTQEKFLIK